MSDVINPGDVARVSTTSVFTNAAGTATDPDTVTFKVWQHGALASATSYVYGTDPEVTKAGTGDYYVDIPIPYALTSRGLWKVEVRGEGTVDAVEQTEFNVVAYRK